MIESKVQRSRDELHRPDKQHILKLCSEPKTYARTTTTTRELEILLTRDFWYFVGELNGVIQLGSMRMSEGS